MSPLHSRYCVLDCFSLWKLEAVSLSLAITRYSVARNGCTECECCSVHTSVQYATYTSLCRNNVKLGPLRGGKKKNYYPSAIQTLHLSFGFQGWNSNIFIWQHMKYTWVRIIYSWHLKLDYLQSLEIVSYQVIKKFHIVFFAPLNCSDRIWWPLLFVM